MHYPELSAARVHSLLREAQVDIAPEQLDIEQRDGRWLVEWNDRQLTWFAASVEGAARLAMERKVLALVQSSCAFAVPGILHIAADGSFDLRTRLEGIVDPTRAHEHLRNDPHASLQLGRWLGEALAQLHTMIKPENVPGWLPHQISWPEPTSWILERLPAVLAVADRAAGGRAKQVLQARVRGVAVWAPESVSLELDERRASNPDPSVLSARLLQEAVASAAALPLEVVRRAATVVRQAIPHASCRPGSGAVRMA